MRKFTVPHLSFLSPVLALLSTGDSFYIMQDWAKQFYSSQAWKKCREEYAKSKGRLCERCLEKGLYKPGEIVHHKVMLTPQNIDDGGVTLDFDNLQLLCRDCHAFVHKGYEPRYKVDELGRITAWDD